MEFMQVLMGGPWAYLVIFFGKIVEITISTIRVVLVTRGERKIGALLSFVEITLWLVIVSGVLSGVAEDPLKIFVYASGFAIGTFTGSLIEDKIGLGTSQVQIIVKEEHGEEVSNYLRELGFGVTVVQGQGKNFPRNILYVIIPRKQIREVIAKTKEFQSNAVITVIDTKPMYGVFGLGK